MLGRRPAAGPSSWKVICSEQISFLPASRKWQCAVIQACTPDWLAFGSACTRSARKAWSDAISESRGVLAAMASGASL